jgi:hypothetical protein
MVTLTSGIMFTLFTYMQFCVWGTLRKVFRVCADRLRSGPRLPKF